MEQLQGEFTVLTNPLLTKKVSGTLWAWNMRYRLSKHKGGFAILAILSLLGNIFWPYTFLLFVFIMTIIFSYDRYDFHKRFRKLSHKEQEFPQGFKIKYNTHGLEYQYFQKNKRLYRWREFKRHKIFEQKGFFVLVDNEGSYHLFFKDNIGDKSFYNFQSVITELKIVHDGQKYEN